MQSGCSPADCSGALAISALGLEPVRLILPPEESSKERCDLKAEFMRSLEDIKRRAVRFPNPKHSSLVAKELALSDVFRRFRSRAQPKMEPKTEDWPDAIGPSYRQVLGQPDPDAVAKLLSELRPLPQATAPQQQSHSTPLVQKLLLAPQLAAVGSQPLRQMQLPRAEHHPFPEMWPVQMMPSGSSRLPSGSSREEVRPVLMMPAPHPGLWRDPRLQNAMPVPMSPTGSWAPLFGQSEAAEALIGTTLMHEGLLPGSGKLNGVRAGGDRKR